MGATLNLYILFGVYSAYFPIFRFCYFMKWHVTSQLIPVTARSKAQVCGRSLAETVGSNPTGSMDVCVL